MHDPEFPPSGGEHDKSNVQRALLDHGIRYPNAQDNDHATWNLYGIRYWPSFVLIDRKGNIRYEGYGEFHVGDKWYEQWDARIRELLAEQVASVEVRVIPSGDKVVVRAIPAPGTKINAHLVAAARTCIGPDGTPHQLDDHARFRLLRGASRGHHSRLNLPQGCASSRQHLRQWRRGLPRGLLAVVISAVGAS